MRHTSTFIGIVVIALLSTGLLVWQRLDKAPERETITLINTFCTASLPDDTCWSTDEDTPYTLETTANIYREYQVGETLITLDNNTSLTAEDGRFRFDSGRIVVNGEGVFTVRDVKVTTQGVVTLVHYSWLNKVDVMVIDGSADIRQGSLTTTVKNGNAVSVDTLPPYDALSPTTFNLNASSAKPFYDWALN